MPGSDEIYVAARTVLVDALVALGPHREAVVLVGAQAVYIRVGEADVAVAPTTTDGDLAFDPGVLADTPALQALMRGAGFEMRALQPGIWEKTDAKGLRVSVDLLIPEAVAASPGRRAARLEGHETGAVMKVVGIEGALVDSDILDVSDVGGRSFSIRVAGPAALLVAKVHKILDRSDSGRLRDKDALDVLRLLRGTSTEDMADRTRRILADSRAAQVGDAGLEGLRQLFGHEAAEGITMAVRATEPLMRPDEVTGSLMALTTDLLRALGR